MRATRIMNTTWSTSSPAVTERLRDAQCLSVVNFDSTIRRTQSSVISSCGFRFTAAYKYIVMFSSKYSLMRGFLCRKETCTVTVTGYWTETMTVSCGSH